MSKIILITGCSTGIGYATAVMLHNLHFCVYATARKNSDIEKLKRNGLKALHCDLDSSDSIKQCVSELLQQTGGKIDVLINNAAYGQVGALQDISRDVLRKQFETNVFGTHEITNLVLPIMLRQGSGHIINVSSVLGLVAMPMRGAYNASKYALEGLTDTLRLECHGSGVAVSLIEPGPITTHFRDNAVKAFTQYVTDRSEEYEQQYQALGKDHQAGKMAPFSLPPEAVSNKILKAINAKHPKARYFVTVWTHLFAFLKRILPTSWLDFLLRRS